MTLSTDLDGFIGEHKRRMPDASVYLAARSGRTVVSCGDPAVGLVLVAAVPLAREAVASRLAESNITTHEGLWTDLPAGDAADSGIWVAGVAYRSTTAMPGLWIDCSRTEPNAAEVLERLYREFIAEGVIEDVGLEAFIKSADPNVLILEPEVVEAFASQ